MTLIDDVPQLRNLWAALPALPGPLWARGAGGPGVQPPGVPVSATPACCTCVCHMLLVSCCMSDAGTHVRSIKSGPSLLQDDVQAAAVHMPALLSPEAGPDPSGALPPAAHPTAAGSRKPIVFLQRVSCCGFAALWGRNPFIG